MSADKDLGSISTANGSALVRMGETTIVCGIKAEIAEPNMATPNEGFIGRRLTYITSPQNID
jgi:exosome complex RNA-binding protein Rrp42 (RNase PH superfamily)